MREPTTPIREQAETLLELSNSILAAAIGGNWHERKALELRRMALLDKVLATEQMDEADGLYLVGILEHVRAVDRTLKEMPLLEPAEAWWRVTDEAGPPAFRPDTAYRPESEAF